MAKRTQYRGDQSNRRQMRLTGHSPSILQRRCGPVEKSEDFQQFFGIARDKPAVGVNLTRTFSIERAHRLPDILVHPVQRQARIDQPG